MVPREGMTVTLNDITQYLTSRGVAKFKLPERLLIADELPRNPLGKLVRKDLLEWAVTQERQVDP